MAREKVSFFWFRRDLRVDDNTGLYQALYENKNVVPLFIYDKEILDYIEDKSDKRVVFIRLQLEKLKNEFEKNGSSFLIKYGKPVDIWHELNKEYDIESVYTNHDYEPYAIKRDRNIKEFLENENIKFFTYKDQVIFEKDEILSGQNKPYTIYTPYKNKWRETLSKNDLYNYPSEKYLNNLFKSKNKFHFPTLSEIGFKSIDADFPSSEIDEKVIKDYDKFRDFPFMNNTSILGLHLRFGTISIRQTVEKAMKLNEVWLNELIWREFFMMILYHFPYVVTKSFKQQYDNMKWLNDKNNFEKWCNGQTGYPIVDAGMRQLNQTGYMHNRVRLVVASFLTKHLLIDWRWGERYFAKKLLDYDMASNNGNWQWCAGTGCDAAPYFRVFNPEEQTKKFDPDFKYIKRWVPEYNTSKYPKPIIEHKIARERALSTYKEGLKK